MDLTKPSYQFVRSDDDCGGKPDADYDSDDFFRRYSNRHKWRQHRNGYVGMMILLLFG